MGSLWNRSGTIERFADDLKADGAQAFFFSGGTTTPLSVYQDAAENSAHAHPVEADARGRWPDVFVPYILAYDVQVKTAEGVQLTYTQNIPNPDPVELSVTPDPVADVVTGMIHPELANTTKAGYVRLNGRTIGNGASSGTERNHDDTEDLFLYLWNNLTDAIAPVSGGRTNAAGDFAANKTITLPNCQGAALVGLDDMGASAGSFFFGLTFDTGNATTAGSRTGVNAQTVTASNMPAHSHSGTTATEGAHTHTGTTGNQSADHTHSGTSSSDGSHTHGVTDPGHVHSGGDATTQTGQVAGFNPTGGSIWHGAPTSTDSTTTGITTNSNGSHTHTLTTGVQSASHTHSFTTSAGSTHSHTFTTDSQGSGMAFNNLGRSVLVTWYIKL